MNIEKEVGYITTAINLLIAELRILNNKKAYSQEYYRILNEHNTKGKVELIVTRNIVILDEMKDKSKAEGRAEGKAELLLKQLIKKFGDLPERYMKQIKLLSLEMIESIAIEIFELQNLEDLKFYFE